MGYYNYENSALVHMRGTGIWIWYNNHKAYIYGQDVGQICANPSQYSAAYTINTLTGTQEGYSCILSLDGVINWYTSKGVSMKFLLRRVADPNNFDAYAALNMLDNEGIINL